MWKGKRLLYRLRCHFILAVPPPLTGLYLTVDNECRSIFEKPVLMGWFQHQIRGGRVQWETQGRFCPLSVRERLALLLDKQRPEDAHGLHQKRRAVRDGEVSDHELLAGRDLRGRGWGGEGRGASAGPAVGLLSPARARAAPAGCPHSQGPKVLPLRRTRPGPAAPSFPRPERGSGLSARDG